MDGDGAVGSAIGLKTVKNPISLVRKIMEDTSKPCIFINFCNTIIIFKNIFLTKYDHYLIV